MHNLAKKIYEKDFWEREIRPDKGVKYWPAKSDMDLYLQFHERGRYDWPKAVAKEQWKYGFAIYQTRELRERHAGLELRFRNSQRPLDGSTLLFKMLQDLVEGHVGNRELSITGPDIPELSA